MLGLESWSAGRWIAAASALAVAARLVRDVGRLRARAIPATRLILPALILIEASLIVAGRATRRSAAPVAAAVEIALAAWAVVSIRRLRGIHADRPEKRIEEGLAAFVPRPVARAVAAECVVISLGLRSLLPPYRRPGLPGFPYIRDAYLRFVPVLFVFTVPADVLLLGVLLGPKHRILHGVITALDVYGLFWILGLVETMRRRPHVVTGLDATLDRGILNRASFSLDRVIAARSLRPFDTKEDLKKYAKGAILMPLAGEPLVEIELREPIEVESLLPPSRRRGSRLIVPADDPDGLVAALESRDGGAAEEKQGKSAPAAQEHDD